MRCRHYIDSELSMLENKIKIQCKLKSVPMEFNVTDGSGLKKMCESDKCTECEIYQENEGKGMKETNMTQQNLQMYNEAYRLHAEIMANGEVAEKALISMMRDLKRMRDEKLYIELGHDTFEEYVENAVGIKKRQAYTYISTYEKIPKQLLQSTAQFGITKLELIASIPDLERENFVEQNSIGEMTTRELKDAVEKIKVQGEQISFLQEQIKLEKTNEELIQELQNKIQSLESKPVEVVIAQPSNYEIEKIKRETEARIKEKYAKEWTEQRALLENKLKSNEQLSDKSEKQIFQEHFTNIQEDFKKIFACLEKIEDGTIKQQYQGALMKYIELIRGTQG